VHTSHVIVTVYLHCQYVVVAILYSPYSVTPMTSATDHLERPITEMSDVVIIEVEH